MHALIVTNMYPTATRPALGSFVRDQVDALRRIDELDVDVFSFAPGGARAYLNAAADLRRRRHGAAADLRRRRHGSAADLRRRRHGDATGYDVVHAHYGLTAWPAFAASGSVHAVTLHGTDLFHPRARPVTLAALPFLDLVATVSEALQTKVPGWAVRGTTAVLPAGVDTQRFHPIPRAEARTTLGLDPNRPYLLFPADPDRQEKRYDRARAVAGDVPLLALGQVDPAQVPHYVNAANAVLVPSDREGFGLAVLEALACDVPVLATPVGIHPEALNGIAGTYCGPFDEATWRAALAPHLADVDPRIQGRASAERFSTDLMATNVVAAWRTALEQT